MKKIIAMVLLISIFNSSAYVFALNEHTSSDLCESSSKSICDDVESKKVLNVKYYGQQESGLVSGCEAVSSSMLLNYYGCDISPRDFSDYYITKKDWSIKARRTFYGADPNSAYVGNPYIKSGMKCGFGCYAPVIVKAINRAFAEKDPTRLAINVTGVTIEHLIDKYIKNDQPVLLWATMDMKESRPTMSWKVDYVDENAKYALGQTYTWIAGEHCLVLVGYDNENYYFNDPYMDHGLIAYNKELVNKRYHELGMQSVAIIEK